VEPVDQVASLIISEESDGNFLVKFVPKVPGAYNITAKINGEDLAKSPFTVQVKERRLEIVGELDVQNQVLEKPSGIAVNSDRINRHSRLCKALYHDIQQRGKVCAATGSPWKESRGVGQAS